jgi:hypothetical protein
MGLSTATENPKEKPVEPLEFEVSKKGWEIRDYYKANNIKSYDDVIWFNGRIDRNSGKIIYFELGRLYQSHQKCVPNRSLD